MTHFGVTVFKSSWRRLTSHPGNILQIVCFERITIKSRGRAIDDISAGLEFYGRSSGQLDLDPSFPLNLHSVCCSTAILCPTRECPYAQASSGSIRLLPAPLARLSFLISILVVS
jgi:hypothetical protein